MPAPRMAPSKTQASDMKSGEMQCSEMTSKMESCAMQSSNLESSTPKSPSQKSSSRESLNVESSAARECGNVLYRKGDLPGAVSAYEKAVRLAPSDPLPLSNLSAAHFEMGNYADAATLCTKALDLLDSDEGGHQPQAALKLKIKLRLVKSYLFLKDVGKLHEFESTEKVALEPQKDVSGELMTTVRTAIDMLVAPGRNALEEKPQRRLVLDRVPRYKPCLQDEPEYFSVGHDDARTQFDESLQQTSTSRLAFLFSGIGDTRNLLATLLAMDLPSDVDGKCKPRTWHFTLNDHKPAVFARDLIIFKLLLDRKIVSLCYVYAAQVMPQWVHAQLQQTMSSLVSELHGTKDVLGCIYVPSAARSQISRHLKTWMTSSDPRYSAQRLRALAQAQNFVNEAAVVEHFLGFLPGCAPNGTDYTVSKNFGIMLPPAALLHKREPSLGRLLQAYGKRQLSAAQTAIDAYLDANWYPNMTLVDLDWEKRRQVPSLRHIPALAFRPHEVAQLLVQHVPSEALGYPKGVFDHLKAFFSLVSAVLVKNKSKIVLEIALGDMADTMDRLRHGILRDLSQKHDRLDPSTFPDLFDRAYLSNIPDYVGGALTTFVHGLPVLRQAETSTITSYVLRNPHHWVFHEQFLSEYLLMADRKMLREHFGVHLDEASARYDKSFSGQKYGPGLGGVMTEPLGWAKSGSGKLSWKQLMPRQEMERWVYAHFLKICLPYERAPLDDNLVIAPLNITMVFHLIEWLHAGGYPAHWLSAILSSLCEGTITTTARTPRAVITEPELARKVFPARKICTRPFSAEVTTLLTLWKPLLPFGLVTPDQALLRLPEIREYKVRFPPRYPELVSDPHFMLVLWNRKSNGPPPVHIRGLLRDDEGDEASEWAARVRSAPDGVHIITAFRWNTDAAEATFWLREDVVEAAIRSSRFEAYVWRTDTWRVAMGPVELETSLVKGESWI